MRIYFVATIAILIAYGIGRAFTPFWLDVAFMLWCGIFIAVWGIFMRSRASKSVDKT
jgi:hypothetical protein